MLNDSNQQIQIIFQDVREIIATVSVRSCSDIPQYKPSGEYWIATDSTSSPVQVSTVTWTEQAVAAALQEDG